MRRKFKHFFVPNPRNNTAGSRAGTESKVPYSVSNADSPTAPLFTCSTIVSDFVSTNTNNSSNVTTLSSSLQGLSISNTFLATTQTETPFTEQEIAKYAKFVSQNQHFIATAVDDEDAFYFLTFACLKTPDNKPVLALVDTGSTMTIMRDSSAVNLNLPICGTSSLHIAGFNTTARQTANLYNITLATSDPQKPLTFTITGSDSFPDLYFQVPKLTENDKKFIFKRNIDIRNILNSWKFRDSKIDMIIGNDFITWLWTQPSYQKHILPSRRALEETTIGCILHPYPRFHGNLLSKKQQKKLKRETITHINYASITLENKEPENEMTRVTDAISQLWKIENLGIESVSIQDDTKKSTLDLLKAFNESAKFNDNGELEVAFPYNGNETRLANNFAVAYRRLQSLIVTLTRGKDRLNEYNQIIMDQLKAGFIELVSDEMMKLNLPQYYIPHRAVEKPDSSTTKLRIVLDASSRAAGQLSLNDCVHTGTNMITPLFGILLRARCTRYIIVADIAKAFHQVRLQPEFRNVTFFMWLKDLNKPPVGDNVIVYRFTRIPFGLACSPFLLNAYIIIFLDLNPRPLNKAIKENIYVDNCLFGTNDRSAILPIITGSKSVFSNMKMLLREYVVNDEDIMNSLDKSDTASSDTIKLLGYKWDSKNDTFTITIAQLDIKHPSKREVASKLAATFDPLGLLSPIMVPFKRLIQKIWSHNTNWKELIPKELLKDWHDLRGFFADQEISIPRQLTTDYSDCETEIVMFSDASQDIYACAAYAYFLRKDKPPVTQLMASKNKIKPSKNESWTIPKLELLAIECASKLASAIVGELRLKITRIRLFTDSSCALYWILSQNRKRQWVANRIDTINFNQTLMMECGIETTIHHCPTDLNPADLATRGLSTSDIKVCKEWFQGPKFLQLPPDEWPCKIEGTVSCPAEFQDLVFSEVIDPVTQKKKKPLIEKPKVPKRKETVLLVVNDSGHQPSFVPYEATNSLRKLVKSVYFVLKALTKFLKNKKWQSKTMQQFSSSTSIIEQLKMSRRLIILEHYKDCLFRKLPLTLVDTNDGTVELSEDGLYRVTSHVDSPVLPREAHRPIYIHDKHPLAILIALETHEINGHLPVQYTRSLLRTKYWFPRDGTLISKVIANCFTCKTANGPPFKYPFSKVLHESRTTPSKPFARVGLDYLGPIPFKKDDGITFGKAYVLIYTCLNTRGAMLRLVPDATTEKYILALKMIFGEVGVPEEIYSDNAPTFKLGHAVINDDILDFEHSQSLTTFIAARDITCHTITPLAPWQGGIYERVVQMVKRHLHKVCGSQVFDYYTLIYVVSGAQTMVNNRPLMPHARSPSDMIAVRPIDFICPGVMIETPPTAIREGAKYSSTEQSLRAHLSNLEETLDRLWKMWSYGYLMHLKRNMHRGRKCSTLKPAVGQIVMIETEMVKRHKWPLGIIVKVLESKKDSEIRSAVVRCRGKEYLRPVCHLIPLETEEPLNPPVYTDENGTTVNVNDYKSTPQLPTAAIFDTEAHFAPELFPQEVFPNICEYSEECPNVPPLDLKTFNQNIENHTIIGDSEMEVQGDSILPESWEYREADYQDPNTVIPDYIQDNAEERLPEGRSRHYLPRKAKAGNINYICTAYAESLSLPSPPECRQSSPYSTNFADWIVL